MPEAETIEAKPQVETAVATETEGDRKSNGVHAVAELTEVLEGARGSQLVILLNGHPDPDSIGSAIAQVRVCEHFGISATIAHVFPVSRAENRAMVKLLDVRMTQVTATEDLERFDYLALVDASAAEPQVELPDGLELLTVVDHHQPSGDMPAKFTDIRPSVGATATIFAEYMENGLVPLSENGRDDVRVATGLLFGIQTDTDDFTLATPADFRAAAYLKPHSDSDVLSRIGRRVIPAKTMDVLGRALADLEVVRDFAIAGVGKVTSRNRDAIGAAADFILRREDIDTVIVFGLVEGRIDGSLRTTSASLDPAAFMVSAFGKDTAGRPFGGGRHDKGGFQIPLGLLAECDTPEQLWEMVNRVVRKRVGRVVPELVGEEEIADE